MFEIRPTGGLCDRLVTIESFIAVTKQLNISDIKMIWLLNNELNCNFEEILQPISGIVVQNKLDISYKSDVLSRIKRKTISLFNNKILNKKHIDLYSLSVSDKYQYVISLLKSNKSRYSFSGLLLSEKTNDYFDCFFPTAEITSTINSYLKHFSDSTIGVHIRRTDNVYAIKNSPSELFYKNIEKEIKENDDVKFYVATDSERELKELIKRYGEKIIYQTECVRSRVTSDGIKSAMIDLFLLSKTQKILGSDWSAFSATAAKLGRIELIKMLK